MSTNAQNNTPPDKQEKGHSLGSNFQKLWVGQAISALGSSFTGFALPLLVYQLTGSALNLAYSAAAHFVPYLLFGLVIGAWSDRVDRRRLMIWTDIGRAAAIATVPLLATMGMLEVWWIYVVIFINSILSIAFDAANFAAVPSLVDRDDLVTANGRIQASYSAMTILGPLLAGAIVYVMPIYDLLLIDSFSFVLSTITLVLIRASFNAPGKARGTSIKHDILEGLRYVFGHPVLRNISLMMMLVNFASITVYTQRVLYAKEQLGATDTEVAIFMAAGGAGVILFSLLAGRLRKRFNFSRVALGALMGSGLATVIMGLTSLYWLGLLAYALFAGLGLMFNINTNSLRQAIAPNHMLGRVMSIAGVLAWSANPLGAYVGGLAIERTQDVGMVFAVVGLVTIIIPVCFAFTALGRAEQYLPGKEEALAPEPVPVTTTAPQERHITTPLNAR